jgi:RNA polymerase sigma factor (sigma-70 family)
MSHDVPRTPFSSHAQRLVRDLAPQVLSALLRRYGRFADAEDAVQEALVAASNQWPREGRPDDARAWLIRVASRRLIDELRRAEARRRREDRVVRERLPLLDPTDPLPHTQHDDTLSLFVLACHPALTLPSQVALTLRAVGGLTTHEIARAFVVPEATVAQRISRSRRASPTPPVRCSPLPWRTSTTACTPSATSCTRSSTRGTRPLRGTQCTATTSRRRPYASRDFSVRCATIYPRGASWR